MAANEGSIFVDSSEIECKIGKARRQNSTRSTPWKIGFELVAGFHAPRELDQLPGRDPGGRYDDAGLLYPSRNGPRAEAFGTIHAVVSEPLGAFPQNLRHPIERLDIIVEGWSPK